MVFLERLNLRFTSLCRARFFGWNTHFCSEFYDSSVITTLARKDLEILLSSNGDVSVGCSVIGVSLGTILSFHSSARLIISASAL